MSPLLLLFLLPSTTLSLSSSPRAAKKYPFQSFEFDQSTGICRKPASFRYSNANHNSNNNTEVIDDEDQYFVLRNVPGDGDCIFHAVLSSVFISMGFMNPDATFAKSNTLVSSMALEMRHVVAKFLSSPDGILYVNNKPVKRVVRCRDLLLSAAKNEGWTTDEYLMRLRQPGRMGGLYGGGPELVTLSNILRRPISIYHLKPPSQHQQTVSSSSDATKYYELERMGVFGEGLFEDQCQKIPDSVISNAIFFTVGGRSTENQQQGQIPFNRGFSPISSPLKSSWHLHVLIADAGENEKHASVLLPSVSILHNDPQ